MKNDTTIPDGKYRVIKISRDALFEFIYESFTDSLEEFLGVSDSTSVVTSFDVDWETGSFICVARNDLGENEHLQMEGIDTKLLLSKMDDTTDTMFKDGRFVELTEEEIVKVQTDDRNISERNDLKCLQYLRNSASDSPTLSDIVEAFEKMSEIPLEEET